MAQMNLLLHGMESPQIDPYNSLRFKLSEIGEKDRVDVILTNPPFGGEEERGILGNFPAGKQTSETALLFLQLIMRRLRRKGNPGRAALVVPDGLLASDGVAARIKRDLLEDFDLHTIVRLPSGVFAPYTGIPTNLLFFTYGGPTEEVWFYELPLPEEYKNYTKTRPLRYEEFEPVREWWANREEGEHAWKVGREEIEANDYDLDIRNPKVLAEDTSVPVAERTEAARRDSAGLSRSVGSLVADEGWSELAALDAEARRELVLGDVLTESGVREEVLPDKAYRLLGISLFGKGPFVRETKLGGEMGAETVTRVKAGDFIYSKLFAWRGAFALLGEDQDGCCVSGEFPSYEIDESEVLGAYLRLYFTRPTVWHEVERKSRGTTKGSRNRFHPERLKEMRITVPELEAQERIVALASSARDLVAEARAVERGLEQLPGQLLAHLYRGDL
jgi:type I restriction enzyme M protein